MKEKDKKKPFKFPLDFKNWDNTKPITFSGAFKRAEKDYFKNNKYSSLHKMYIYEKDKAELAFEEIYTEVINAFKIVHIVAPKLGMKLTKVKNTEKEFRMSDKQTKKIQKMDKKFCFLTNTKGLRASVAIEKIAKESNPPLKPSTVETYLPKNKYKVLPDDKNTD